jgi:hypothetical protein
VQDKVKGLRTALNTSFHDAASEALETGMRGTPNRKRQTLRICPGVKVKTRDRANESRKANVQWSFGDANGRLATPMVVWRRQGLFGDASPVQPSALPPIFGTANQKACVPQPRTSRRRSMLRLSPASQEPGVLPCNDGAIIVCASRLCQEPFATLFTNCEMSVDADRHVLRPALRICHWVFVIANSPCRCAACSKG